MNRTDGLVQRRRDTNQGSSSGNPVASRDDSNGRNDDYENDADSKETRLTLMEEVLLLGLKDKEVRELVQFAWVRPVRELLAGLPVQFA